MGSGGAAIQGEWQEAGVVGIDAIGVICSDVSWAGRQRCGASADEVVGRSGFDFASDVVGGAVRI